MLKQTTTALASLRYRRPYWMMFLKNTEVDNWRIYTVISKPDHQLIEMNHQSWLGGLDRPYTRPKCMAHQPLWLEKKRFLLKKSRLINTETPLEKFVLEWHTKFHSFMGTLRPIPDDLNTAFDLVERPLDLSYACQLLAECRNNFNIRLDEDAFLIFLEACLRVDRLDVAKYGLENAESLGFWHIEKNCRAFVEGAQSWYKKSALDGLYYPLEGNESRNGGKTAAPAASDVDPEVAALSRMAGTSAPVGEATASGDAPHIGEHDASSDDLEDELAQLEAELQALQEEEARAGKK